MTTPTRRGAGLLAVVAFGAAVIWIGLRPVTDTTPLRERPTSVETSDPSVDPQVAEAAFRRVEIFRSGGAGERISLTEDEVTALLRHAVPGMLPAGVVDPTVRLESGAILVEARLASNEFAATGPLASALGVLPDTIVVDLRGRLVSTRSRFAFYVEEARASHVPLPRGAVVAIAGALAARADDRLVADGVEEPTLTVRWPAGVTFAEVVGDRLVLRRDEPNVDRAVDGSDVP